MRVGALVHDPSPNLNYLIGVLCRCGFRCPLPSSTFASLRSVRFSSSADVVGRRRRSPSVVLRPSFGRPSSVAGCRWTPVAIALTPLQISVAELPPPPTTMIAGNPRALLLLLFQEVRPRRAGLRRERGRGMWQQTLCEVVQLHAFRNPYKCEKCLLKTNLKMSLKRAPVTRSGRRRQMLEK